MRVEEFSEELIDGIRNALGNQVSSIILYGSFARGTQAEGSDVDIAVIVKDPLNFDQEDLLSDVVVDLNLKYDTVFSVIDIEDNVIQELENISPFYNNVRREGVVLWNAA